jgi:hypothetical protein
MIEIIKHTGNEEHVGRQRGHLNDRKENKES